MKVRWLRDLCLRAENPSALERWWVFVCPDSGDGFLSGYG